MNRIYFSFTVVCTFCGILFGCSKTDFLNEKPNKAMIIPYSFDHFQALMDRDAVMNGGDGQGLTPQLGESRADNFYLSDSDFISNLPVEKQNYYTWEDQPYEGGVVLDWDYPYRAILACNAVLDGLTAMSVENRSSERFQYIRAQALFHRAHMYYSLAQVFCPPFDKAGANDGAGIPLRDGADMNNHPYLASVGETYNRILEDFHIATQILPTEDTYKTRPSKQAGYGMLARVYLTMREYELAGKYADSCLAIRSGLLDYNSLDATDPYLFQGIQHPVNEKEIIFYAAMLSDMSQNFPTSYMYHSIDTNLYDSYADDDLRKIVFFEDKGDGTFRFKGSYNYRPTMNFSGLATDEMYLIRAECHAREGKIDETLADLNFLLQYRWREGAEFVPIAERDQDMLLDIVLRERRKELLFRGLRWSDLRRFNLEGYGYTLKRNINDREYLLPPDDSRWTMPFPLQVTVR